MRAKTAFLFMNCILSLSVLSSCSNSRNALEKPSPMAVEEVFLAPGPERNFAIRYVARVRDIPEGTRRLRLWWPVPRSTTLQKISDLKFSGPATPNVQSEDRYGNLIAHVELKDPPREVEFEMAFRCKRREARVLLVDLQGDGSDPSGAYRVFREPGRLVVMDDEIRRLAEEATRGKTGTVARARAIYDLVLSRMTYDKTGTGWGRGDSLFACQVGKGNCTDFHALFNALCRAAGIASGFEIGLYLPYEESESADWQLSKSGYHCWALFRVPGKTWVPVDASEGDKIAGREDFFFGNHTANRVALSAGRDIVLAPPQEGEPLNYLLNPHAEVDGRPHGRASKAWYYRDIIE